MQFFCFFVSNMRIRASVLLIYSIRFLNSHFHRKLPTVSNVKEEKPASKNRTPVQLVKEPRRVSPPERRKKVQSFSSATCAAKKILLGLQTCAPSASGGQRVRCGQAANPFVKKEVLF